MCRQAGRQAGRQASRQVGRQVGRQEGKQASSAGRQESTQASRGLKNCLRVAKIWLSGGGTLGVEAYLASKHRLPKTAGIRTCERGDGGGRRPTLRRGGETLDGAVE